MHYVKKNYVKQQGEMTGKEVVEKVRKVGVLFGSERKFGIVYFDEAKSQFQG